MTQVPLQCQKWLKRLKKIWVDLVDLRGKFFTIMVLTQLTCYPTVGQTGSCSTFKLCYMVAVPYLGVPLQGSEAKMSNVSR